MPTRATFRARLLLSRPVLAGSALTAAVARPPTAAAGALIAAVCAHRRVVAGWAIAALLVAAAVPVPISVPISVSVSVSVSVATPRLMLTTAPMIALAVLRTPIRLVTARLARLRLGLRGRCGKPTEQSLPQRRPSRNRRGRLRGRRRLGLRCRRGRRRQHGGHGGLLGLHRATNFFVGCTRVGLRIEQLVARCGVLWRRGLVVTHAPQGVIRRLEIRVADENNADAVRILYRLHPVPLLVQDVIRHIERQLSNDLRSALLTRFLADQAQDRKRERLDASHVAGSVAARTVAMGRLLEGRAQALPRQFQ